MQDSYFQILNPEPQQITLADVEVVSEDMVTREYYDAAIGEYVNTKESMITMNLQLLTTMSE